MPKSSGGNIRKKPTKDNPLSEQQKIFCEEYVKHFNGTKAAITAGYSEVSAHTVPGRLLKLPRVQEYMDKYRKKIQKESGITIHQIVLGLKDIFDTSPADVNLDWAKLKNFEDIPPEVKKCIKKISVIPTKEGDRINIEFYDRVSAADMLMKHLGGYEKDNEQRKPDPVDIKQIIGNFVNGPD